MTIAREILQITEAYSPEVNRVLHRVRGKKKYSEGPIQWKMDPREIASRVIDGMAFTRDREKTLSHFGVPDSEDIKKIDLEKFYGLLYNYDVEGLLTEMRQYNRDFKKFAPHGRTDVFFDTLPGHDRVLPNDTWVLHFCWDYSAELILRHGFESGTPEERSDNLGLTTRFHKTEKTGGYNFGVLADDILKDPEEIYRYFTYGDTVLMFQTSGINVYHETDQQKQFIFWGLGVDESKIYPIYRDTLSTVSVGEMEHRGRPGLVHFDIGNDRANAFARAIRWVQTNHGMIDRVRRKL